MTDVASMTYNDMRNLIESAIGDSLDVPADGHPLSVWVVDMTDEWAVYQVDYDGELLQVTYTVGDNDQIALGKPASVAATTSYQPLPEGKSSSRWQPMFEPRQRVAALDGVKREPLTYERHAPRSYFKDLVAAETRGDTAARSRLQRHAVEMEQRVNPNRTDGQGGYFAPPGWLIDKFFTAKRQGRVTANLIEDAGGVFPVPPGVQSVNVPLIGTGTDDNEDPDLDPDPEQDLADQAKTSPIITVSGLADVALQLLEQSPPGAHLDTAIFKDLTASYDADLNAALLYGSGSGGQFQGIVTAALAATPSANTVTYTDASPTLSEMYPFVGQTMAKLGDLRDLPPEAWIMRTARWAWIGTNEDSSLRPIVPPELAPPPVPDGDGRPDAIASVLGLPAYLDDSITATSGATANQDQIIAFRPSDLYLFEGTPKENVYLDVLSGTLSARIQLHNYAAFIIGHLSGIWVLVGTGMVVQSGF